jgi:hypothetical protein
VRGSKQQTKPGLGAALKKLFRQVVKVVTGRDADAPAPKKASRRRSGEDGARLFKKAATRVTRQALRSVVRAFGAPPWLADTLDWLDLWQQNEPAVDPPQEAPHNHLSPEL